MGDVAITYKIMPDTPDVDLEKMKGSIEETVQQFGRLHGTEERPIAFGLKAVMVTVIMPDKTGKPDDLEEALTKVPDVASVETTSLGLL